MTIASSGSGSPFGFVGGQGYQKDPDSGLMLLGARFYDPSVGRFISRDPIGYEGGFNVYGYCGNNPVNATDPSGLEPGKKYTQEEFDKGVLFRDAASDAYWSMIKTFEDTGMKWEYGTILYQLGDKTYSYIEVYTDKHISSVKTRPAPVGTVRFASVHSHTRTEDFSKADIRNAEENGNHAVVVTPTGKIRLYDVNNSTNEVIDKVNKRPSPK